MTDLEIENAVIDCHVDTCLNDPSYLQDVVAWLFKDFTPEQFQAEYAILGLGERRAGYEAPELGDK